MLPYLSIEMTSFSPGVGQSCNWALILARSTALSLKFSTIRSA